MGERQRQQGLNEDGDGDGEMHEGSSSRIHVSGRRVDLGLID